MSDALSSCRFTRVCGADQKVGDVLQACFRRRMGVIRDMHGTKGTTTIIANISALSQDPVRRSKPDQGHAGYMDSKRRGAVRPVSAIAARGQDTSK